MRTANASQVVKASRRDLRAAVKSAEKRSGFTYDQLAAQAQAGRFATVRARQAWVAVGDLGDLAQR